MYQPSHRERWTGRVDEQDGDSSLRWHQVIQCIDLEKKELPVLEGSMKGYALLGFRSDEGVRRNQGRVGAVEGSESIRKACMNFACHFDRRSMLLVDCGDIICEGNQLEAAQDELAEKLEYLTEKNFFPLILGGGHEVSFGGYKGMFEAVKYTNKTIGILNFDAHFDLRSLTTGGSSGTPFLQIAGLCSENHKSFRYMCLGIQPHSNTESLFRKANELGAKYILGEDLQIHNLPNIEHALLGFLKKSDHIYLTIDMDVFDASDAPGVSAPAVPGVDKRMIFNLLKVLLSSGKVIGCDIAETNPSYDIDNRTARLAAYLLYTLVNFNIP